MTLDDLIKFYGSGYQFELQTKMSHANFVYWRKKGYVPILTQLRIEALTKGALKAQFNDNEKCKHADKS